MLTPKDIENPARKSGYDHVGYNVSPGKTARKPYQGVAYGGKRSKAGMAWIGPRRATALEAAQDYCDYVNADNAVSPAKPALKSAGHARGARKRLSDDPEVEAALGVLRDARGRRKGNQGYVYCITDGEYLKVGYSTNPEARVAELQTGNARPLALLGTIPGTLEDEAALHAKFIEHNVLMEWFRLDEALLSEFNIEGKEATTP